jgi:hypothetical protein
VVDAQQVLRRHDREAPAQDGQDAHLHLVHEVRQRVLVRLALRAQVGEQALGRGHAALLLLLVLGRDYQARHGHKVVPVAPEVHDLQHAVKVADLRAIRARARASE